MDAETKREIEALRAALFAVLDGVAGRPTTALPILERAADSVTNDDARVMLQQRASELRAKLPPVAA